MAQLLRQSTARLIRFGPAVAIADGVTPVTSLASGTVDEVGVYEGEGTAITSLAATAMTHRAGGIYTMTLPTTAVDTLGPLDFYVRDDSACLPIIKEFMVVPGWYYDLNVLGLGIESGTLQAVTSGSAFRLHAGAVGVNDDLNGCIVLPISGTGAGQAPRTIVDSVASDDSVVVDPAFTTAPSTDTVVLVMPAPPAPTLAAYAPKVDAIAISGDSTAADNAELFFDGTGYNASNSGVGTVGTAYALDGHTAQTGDSYALAAGATGFAAIDTVVDAVKAKTDSLTFTVATKVDANVQTVNDVALKGIGTSGSPWAPDD